MGAYGLAFAQSIVAAIEVMILFAVMATRIPGLFDKRFVQAIGRMISATGFMAIISYVSVVILQLTTSDQRFWLTFPKFATIVAVSFVAYVFFSKRFKLLEADIVIKHAKRLLFSRAK
jgi:hypothetical protein